MIPQRLDLFAFIFDIGCSLTYIVSTDDRQLQCAAIIEYLRNKTLPNIAVRTKHQFYDNYNSSRSDGDTMHTGFTTLYSHQCPIIRPNYQCSNLNDDRFENYTINMGFDQMNGCMVDKDKDNCNMNLESKFLQRLFDNGAFLNSKKNLTIVFWGNSYLRQAFEAIECLLFQFDFTPLKFFKYTDSKHFEQYNKANYINKFDYKAEIKVETNLHHINTNDKLYSPFLKPCENSKSTMLDAFRSKFGVKNIQEYILKYTNWTDIYAEYYLSQNKNDNISDVDMSKFFFNLNKTDIENKLLSIDKNKDDNDNDDDDGEVQWSLNLSDKDRKQIAKNMGQFSYDCGDDQSYIEFFNNKTQTTNTLIYITSNFDKAKHTMMQGFEIFVKKYDKYNNVSHFINDIDVVFINFGNKYHNVDRYSLKMFAFEYEYFANIRKKYYSNYYNYSNISFVVVSHWDGHTIDKKEWQTFENNFIKTNNLPIVYYNLTNTIVGINKNQTKRLHSVGNHWCMPGPSIKYAFTFLQIVEILVQYCTNINN